MRCATALLSGILALAPLFATPASAQTWPTRIATAPLLLLTHPGSGLTSVKDLIDKAKAEPGKFAFGSPGHGTINQLAAEWLALEAGIKLLHVPYRGGAAMANGLAAGDTAL